MRPSILAAVTFAILTGATPLPAQRPVTVGVAAGGSLPQGRFGDGADAGWHALGTLALGNPAHPLGLRVDGAYNRFGAGGEAGGLSQTVSSATLNPTYRLPSAGRPVAPYLMAGAGAYHLDCSGDDACGGTTRFGWNAGVGTRFVGLGLRGFVEARFHRVSVAGGAVQYVPVTFGLLF